MIGGSGGSGACGAYLSGNGVSAAECLVDRWLSCTPGTALSYTIGAAGAGGIYGSNQGYGNHNGTPGGNTTISNGTITYTAAGSSATPGGIWAATPLSAGSGNRAKGSNAVERWFVIAGSCAGSATNTITAGTTSGIGGDCGEHKGGAGATSDGTYCAGGGGGASPFGPGGDAGVPGSSNPPSSPPAGAYGAGPGGVSPGGASPINGAAGMSGAIEFEYWSWAP